jgi:hypothetical protein
MSSENLKEITMEKNIYYLKIGRKLKSLLLLQASPPLRVDYPIIDSIFQLDDGTSVSFILTKFCFRQILTWKKCDFDLYKGFFMEK